MNPDYFDTFQDKEYAVDVKRNLIKTRNDLFDTLDNSKKHIVQTIEDREKELKDLIGSVRKPAPPVKPLLVLDKYKKIKKPVKSKHYYKVPKEIRSKDSTLDEQGFNFYHTLGVIGVILISAIPMYILETIIGKEKNSPIVVAPLILLMLYYGWYMYKHSQKYKLRQEFYEYENAMSRYQRYVEYTKKTLKEYDIRLKNYMDNQETILQAYQNELNQYQNYKDQIENLKKEIAELYQDFTN